jgi:hypothetical protein
MVGTLNAINATLYDKLNFNFIRDIAPVAGVLRAPYVMVLNPSVLPKSIRLLACPIILYNHRGLCIIFSILRRSA